MREQATFGQWVKARRKRLDMSREQVALCVGCSLATIEKVETGERRPSRQIAELLAKCLQVQPDDVPLVVGFARGEVAAAPPALHALITRANSTEQYPLPNLPSPATAFIGREREVAAVRALLRREEVRLLTLTGPPGIGKTRLSLQAALGLASDFSDGIHFIALAPISDGSLVAPAITGVLGVRETGSRPIVDALKGWLRGKRLLLVLDNFEQVVEAGGVVSELLLAAPGLKALATSRSALRLYGEHIFPVPPMSLPDLSSLPPAEKLTEYEAIDLFRQRAEAAYSGFSLNSENSAAVAEICHRLDGLPLAIELAANRVKALSPRQILERLGVSLDLLADGANDLPPRQKTLRGAIDWSYTLLTLEEQALFRRLSVFSGGCTLEAAEDFELGSSKAKIQNPKSEIVNVLASLVDKSLLRRDESGGQAWFSMLETVREYAWEKLGQVGEEMEDALYRHAGYYLKLAEQSEGELLGVGQGGWLTRLEREHDNFRAALHRLFTQGEIETAARMAAALRRFWYLHAHLGEGRRWLQMVLDVDTENALPPELQAKVLHATGTLSWAQGDNDAAGRFFRESLAIWRVLGDKRGVANMLNNLGGVALPQGDYETAHAMHSESLALYRELGDKWSIALSLANLGLVALNRGEYQQAKTLLTDSLRLRREIGDRQGVAQSLNNLGIVMRCLDAAAEARSLHSESLALFRELGDRWSAALALVNLGFVALKGDVGQAKSLFESSLAIFIELDARQGVATCFEGLAEVAVSLGKMRNAALLFGAAEGMRDSLGIPLPRDRVASYTRSRAVAHIAMGEARFSEAWEVGRAMTVEQVCAHARALDSH